MLDALLEFDTYLFLLVNRLNRPDWLTAVMSFASTAGTYATAWLFLALFVIRRHTTGVWHLILALLLTYSMVDLVLKPSFGRARPSLAHADVLNHTVVPSTASFPSGHAASAAAGAFALSRVWPRASSGLWGFALLISCSRVYLGMHYPADIFVGLIVGYGCAYFVTGGVVYGPLRRGG